jgi:hypothetical protein
MANVANVKVKQGNVLSLSGSSVEITGSTTTVGGNLNVQGTISASVLTISETIISSSVIHHSGSTRFGDNVTQDKHQFSGSVNIDGLVSSSVGFSGSAAGLTGVIKSVTAGTNLTASTVNGAVTVALTSSITGGLNTLSGVQTGSFTVLSASTAEFSGNVLIYGTASLSSNPDAAYVRYVASSGSVVDKIVIFPGIYTDGQVTASLFSGSGAGLTNLPAANLTGIVPLVNGGTGQSLSGNLTGKLLIGSGSSLVTGSLIAGTNVSIVTGSGSITVSVTGSLGVSEITSSDPNITVTNGSGPTVTLDLNSTVVVNTLTASSVLVTGSLVASSSFARSRITFDTVDTASYNVSSIDQVIIVTFGTDDDVTIFLPSATQIDGRELIIKRGNDQQLTQRIQVTPSGSETIDLDAAGLEIWGPFESKTLIADSGSANWIIV